MGVYIKGMEMPKHCMDCPFMVSRDNDDCILQSAEANENFENWEQMKAGCPLVPVPPHGRLIDADALKDLYHYNTHDSDIDKAWICNIRRALDNAPTIIEAEESET